MFLNTKLQLNVPERSSQPNLHSAMAHRAKMSPPPGTCASVPCMACNQPHPLEHTTDNPPAKPTMKGIPAYGLLVKVAFFGCVETTLDNANLVELDICFRLSELPDALEFVCMASQSARSK